MPRVAVNPVLVLGTAMSLSSMAHGQVVIDMPPPPATTTSDTTTPPTQSTAATAPSATAAPASAPANATAKAMAEAQASALHRYGNRQQAQDAAGNARSVDIDSIIVRNSSNWGYRGYDDFGWCGGYGWGWPGWWGIVPGYWGSWSGMSTCGGGLQTGSYSSFGGINVQIGF